MTIGRFGLIVPVDADSFLISRTIEVPRLNDRITVTDGYGIWKVGCPAWALLVPRPRSFGTRLRNKLKSEALPGEVVSEHDSKQV